MTALMMGGSVLPATAADPDVGALRHTLRFAAEGWCGANGEHRLSGSDGVRSDTDPTGKYWGIDLQAGNWLQSLDNGPGVFRACGRVTGPTPGRLGGPYGWWSTGCANVLATGKGRLIFADEVVDLELSLQGTETMAVMLSGMATDGRVFRMVAQGQNVGGGCQIGLTAVLLDGSFSLSSN